MADLTKTTLVTDTAVAATANSGAATGTIAFDGNDQKMVIRIGNTDAATATVTFDDGDGMRGVLGEYNFSVSAAGAKYAILESARFKQLGTSKLTFAISGATTVANVKLEVLALP